MNTTIIVVNETGVIEVANLSQAFINHLSEMVEGSKKNRTRKPRKTCDWKDEERELFRARMMAGREAKALAESKPKVMSKKDPLGKLAMRSPGTAQRFWKVLILRLQYLELAKWKRNLLLNAVQ